MDVFNPAFSLGVEFNISSRFILPSDEDTQGKPQSTPGYYTILWRRLVVKLSCEIEFPKNSNRSYDGGKQGELSSTRIVLPPLGPPQENIVALLDVPAAATLHVPLDLTLLVRNYHPTSSANIVCQLDTDSIDTFVVSGLRSGRLPILLPGAEEKVIWRLIPMECGHIRLPKIKVYNRRVTASVQSENSVEGQDEGEIVDVVDFRRNRNFEILTGPNPGNQEEELGQMTVLVRPGVYM